MNFVNEPLLELRRAPVREALVDALAALDRSLPLRVPVLVAGERRDAPTLRSADPGSPGPDRRRGDRGDARGRRRGGRGRRAGRAGVGGARRGRTRRDPVPRRRRAAPPPRHARRARRPRVREAVAGGRRRRLRGDRLPRVLRATGDRRSAATNGLVQLPGERNTLRYAARGVVAVIGPWNFPLAIPAGMAAAGLATGNAVVLKPAEQSPACAAAVVDALHAAGVPPAALSLLPGEGDVGARLVAHPGVHTIAFTGSGAVGLEILRTAAVPAPGQRHLKRVVAEMGGKNCVIVDADADLDDAVPALAYSAFGFAGQKCSAAARALVHERIADTLLERLHGAVEALLVDQAQRFGVDVPPVIEQAARDRIEGYVSWRARRARGSSSRASGLSTAGSSRPP